MNEELLDLLEKMKQKDLEIRSKLADEGRLYGVYEQEMQNVHIENARALNEIIDHHGWPGISKVGIEGARAAWLIAQHAICTPELQRKFLKHLSEAAKAGDAPARQMALLTDRIRFNEGRPQVYGTVYDWNENGELFCEVENEDNIDDIRAGVGLPQFQQALVNEAAAIRAEGGGPPQDFQTYKQSAKEWAQRVGWQ